MRFVSLTSLIALILVSSANCQQSNPVRNQIPFIPLCELLQKPLIYSGKTVTTTARIMSGRHVTGIWDQTCRSLGADLHFDDSAGSTPGIV
jgi:hypothetical protein